MGHITLDSIQFGQEEIRDSALRGALLFDSTSDEISGSNDTLSIAVLGFVMDCSNGVSEESIVSHFSDSFSDDSDRHLVSDCLKELCDKGLIKTDGVHYYTNETQEKAFFDELINKTNDLILSIRRKTEEYLKKKLPDIVEEIIKKALNVYLNQFAYAYFGVKKEATTEQIDNALQVCRDGFKDDPISADALILTLSETIQSEDEQVRNVLIVWAKAFLAAEVTRKDPLLNNLRSSKMQGKEFVLDTDIVLHCLTDNTRLSSLYKSMVSKLLKMKCKVVIPEEVLSEVRNHADAAKSRYKMSGSSIVSYSDDMLDAEVNNVFIEDFVHLVQKDSHQDRSSHAFCERLDNIFDSRYPDLLQEELDSRFEGLVYSNNTEIDIQDLPLFEALSEKVLRLTELSDKAKYRTPEENERISKTDARLYFYVYRRNGDVTDTSRFLSSKVYLLTNTTKSFKAAKEIQLDKDNIICNPSVLIGVLMRIGNISEKEEILNLFENPFLAYTGAKIWERIKPLVDAGAKFKEKNIKWMHHHYADRLDGILTAVTIEEKIQAIHELDSIGLRGIFTEDQVIRTYNENKELREKVESQQKEIEQYKMNQRLYAKPVKKGKSGRVVKNSNRTKKR